MCSNNYSEEHWLRALTEEKAYKKQNWIILGKLLTRKMPPGKLYSRNIANWKISPELNCTLPLPHPTEETRHFTYGTILSKGLNNPEKESGAKSSWVKLSRAECTPSWCHLMYDHLFMITIILFMSLFLFGVRLELYMTLSYLREVANLQALPQDTLKFSLRRALIFPPLSSRYSWYVHFTFSLLFVTKGTSANDLDDDLEQH